MRHDRLGLIFAIYASLGFSASAAERDFEFVAGISQDGLWEGWTPTSHSLVRNLDSLVGLGFEAGHRALDLDDASPLARGIYLASGGVLMTMFNRANAIYFGHEGAHFQFAHQYGRHWHRFIDHDTGRVIPFARGYLNSLLHGVVGGTASSRREGDPDLDPIDTMWANNAGVNWQMAHSENILRQRILRGQGRLTDAIPFMFNRGYMAFYSARDMQLSDSEHGDFVEYGEWMRESQGIDNPVEKISAISFLAMFASPGFLNSTYAFQDYVQDGDLTYDPFWIHIGRDVKLSWDIPTYAGPVNFTLAPTIYLSDHDRLAGKIGARAAMIGLGYEFAAFGEAVDEPVFYAAADFNTISASWEISGGSDGLYSNLGMTYWLGDHVGAKISYLHSEGDSLRGHRNLPQGGDLIWAGFSFDFGKPMKPRRKR